MSSNSTSGESLDLADQSWIDSVLDQHFGSLEPTQNNFSEDQVQQVEWPLQGPPQISTSSHVAYQDPMTYPWRMSSTPTVNFPVPYQCAGGQYGGTFAAQYNSAPQYLHIDHMTSQVHHAEIALVADRSWGYKAVLKKRKRHRTMFTTEQVETLEEVFRTRPYVRREDRKFLMQKLKLDDRCIKIWFQNRRLKAKRKNSEELEAAAVSAQEADSTSPDATNSTNSVANLGHMSVCQVPNCLDCVESQLLETTPDANGFVALGDDGVEKLANLIGSTVPDVSVTLENSRHGDYIPVFEPVSPPDTSESSSYVEEVAQMNFGPNELLLNILEVQPIV